MTAFETYKLYLAVTRHFNNKTYDFFKYNGNIKASEKSFMSHKDQHWFLKISRMRDPYSVVVGNVLYNPTKWIGAFHQRYADQFNKYRQAGSYNFKQDLAKLKNTFNDNFVVDTDNSIPYILSLLDSQQISLFTCCVFESLLNCDTRWKKHDQYLLFGKSSQKIIKATPFFEIKSDKYRALVTEHFRKAETIETL